MLSNADRQRRYRRHAKGDHSLCDPRRCSSAGPREPEPAPPIVVTVREQAPEPTPAPEPPVTPREQPDPAPAAPGAGYGPRGAALWVEMRTAKLGPTHRVLLQEACRIADRLDRLDAMLEGRESWVRLRSRDDEQTEFVVIVDGMLAEARQQASALKAIVAELRAATAPAKPATGRPAATSSTPSEPTKGGKVASLAAAAARRRAPAG